MPTLLPPSTQVETESSMRFGSLKPTVGVVIRFKNSEATLSAIIASLQRQTLQPQLILGVNNQSTDRSPEILRSANAKILNWQKPYRHPSVLNFAIKHCPTDLVLVVSSHTVLESSHALASLVSAMADPRTACASVKWDDDPFYSDAIDWQEMKSKGLKFGSIYSNSLGILRRSLWEQTPFDESFPTLEDGAWALEQLRRGYLCRRIGLPFSYRRVGPSRDYEFAVMTFQQAESFGLSVQWLGVKSTLIELCKRVSRQWVASRGKHDSEINTLIDRLTARFTWRHSTLRKRPGTFPQRSPLNSGMCNP